MASLLTHLLNDESKDRLPSSIYESVEQYLENRVEIKIDMQCFRSNFYPLLIDSLFGQKGYKMCHYGSEEEVNEDLRERYDVIDEKEHSIPDYGDNTNILRLSLLKKFKNLKTLYIQSVETSQGDYWPVSLLSLLSILTSTKIEKITIEGKFKQKAKKSWFSTIWAQHQSSLEQAYADKGYLISYKGDYIFIVPETQDK